MTDQKQLIKDSIDIVQLIGETVTLTKQGTSFRGAISSTSKSGKSLIVDPQQQIFNDTAGEAGGDVYSWIAFTKGLDIVQDFHQILTIAAKKAGIELSHHNENPDKQQVLTILQAAAGYYHSQLTEEHIKYIRDTWGINDESIDKLLIGFAPKKPQLENELKDIFKNDDLKKSGLFYADGTILTDVFRGRIMFPYWKSGQVVYFIGRDPDHNEHSTHGKYIKQPVHTETRQYISEVIDNNVFYGEDSIKREDTCLITEGVTDCIMAMQAGIPCISPVTVRIKVSEQEHALQLVKNMSKVHVCNDNEDNNAGRDGAIATAEYLEANGVSVGLIEIPRHAGVDKIDLAEFLSNHDSEALMKLPKNNVWNIKLEALDVPPDPIDKARTVLNFITSSLTTMDETSRNAFVKNTVRLHFKMDKAEINKILKRAESDLKDVKKFDDRFFDESGRLKVKLMSEYVMSLSRFITLDDTKTIYHYQNGVYIPRGEDLISKIVQRTLGDANKIHHVSEILHFIRFETLTPRDTVNNETCRINLLNGVYNLNTDTLEDHSPDNIFITQIPVEYDRDAECPAFKKFIGEITDPNEPDDIQTIYEFIGYCLIPDTKIQRALMCIGNGSNGKSKLLEAIQEFIGHKNSSGQSLQKLETNQYSTSELFGKLVNIFPDLASGMIYENSVFKMLVGDEGSITAERKYEHPFTFKNTARLIFSANNLPPVPADNFAYMRRWILIEFPHKFEGDEIDIHLKSKITTHEEQSGLLNIVIPALKRILVKGDYTHIKSTEEVNRIYRINSDPIASFTDECIIYSEDDTLKLFIYEKYVNWCLENLKAPKTEPIFAKRFIKLGYQSGRESSSGFNGKRNTTWENCTISESVRGTKNYPDVKNREQEDEPSGWQGKKPLCSAVVKYNIKNEENIIFAYSNNREKNAFTLTDSSKTSQPTTNEIRQGKKYYPDGTLTDGIDIKNITQLIIQEKDKSHPSGVIPNVEQFASVVKYNNKETLGSVEIGQMVEIVYRLLRNGWR